MLRFATSLFLTACLVGGTPLCVLSEELPTLQSDNDCGVYSLYTMLRLSQLNVDFAKLRADLPTNPEHGLSMENLREASKKLGVVLHGKRLKFNELPLDRPVIALLRLDEGHGHFVVLNPVGNLGKSALYLDFPRSPKVVAYADIFNSQAWTGLILTPESHWDRARPWIFFAVGVLIIAISLFWHFRWFTNWLHLSGNRAFKN